MRKRQTRNFGQSCPAEIYAGQKKKKRKIREGSLDVEDLTASRAESSSEAEPLDRHLCCTPRAKPPDLKLYIRPIDKNKTLKNTNLTVIAKTINSCCGHPPDFVKPAKYGILAKCKNEIQLRKLKELEMIGNIPITVQDQIFYSKGVISGIPTEMTDSEIQLELKRQNVINVTRIMRKAPKQTNQETKSESPPPPFNLKQNKFRPGVSYSRLNQINYPQRLPYATINSKQILTFHQCVGVFGAKDMGIQ